MQNKGGESKKVIDMSKLQNNYTTPEQSKRLLELGVPADSADCYYGMEGINPITDEPYEREIFIRQNAAQIKRSFFNDFAKLHIPCWSVGLLIKIMLNSQIDTGTYALGIMLDKDMFSIESLIDIIDEDKEEFDFSKLED